MGLKFGSRTELWPCGSLASLFFSPSYCACTETLSQGLGAACMQGVASGVGGVGGGWGLGWVSLNSCYGMGGVGLCMHMHARGGAELKYPCKGFGHACMLWGWGGCLVHLPLASLGRLGKSKAALPP